VTDPLDKATGSGIVCTSLYNNAGEEVAIGTAAEERNEALVRTALRSGERIAARTPTFPGTTTIPAQRQRYRTNGRRISTSTTQHEI